MDGQPAESRPQLSLKDLGFKTRVSLRLEEGIKVDDSRGDISRTLEMSKAQSVGYLRAEQTKGKAKKIILMLKPNEAGEISLIQIPGVHDVNVLTGEEPFDAFRRILKSGYSGGPMMNVFLLDENPSARFSEVFYQNNEVNGTHVDSIHEVTRGDRYRLLLWSGFSANYSTKFPSKSRRYAYATVTGCPVEDIDPFILVKEGLSEQEQKDRIEYYRQHLVGISNPYSVKVMIPGKAVVEIKSN